MKTLLCAVLLMVLSLEAGAQQLPLKREARAAWIATVTNIDWPSSTTASVEQQKSQLISIFNSLAAAGVNIAVFQVRSECDAMYNSPYEPWSQWLTGRQGTAPSPMWDPLEFAVAEAHKRGMELHAWFNPYRAERSVGSYTTASTHVTNAHPDWILQVGSIKFLNPGLQSVRDYVTKVIMDVVRRYDIDAAHMDDYFYVQGITSQDAATFAANNPSSLALADWRRDNVNRLVKEVYDSIQVVKPWVKWGISPSGIWKSGVPVGITGMSHYDELYCDPLTWMNGKYIDYLAPQLYWKIGGSQDFTKLLPWWNSVSNGRQMFPGLAVYRILSGASAYPSASEILNQIRFQHANSTVKGVFLYTTNNLTSNQGGVTDSLKNDLYKYHALVPSMDWKDQVPPNAPRNIRYGRKGNAPIATVTWDAPAKASDNDTASLYVVYQPAASSADQATVDDARNITSVTNDNAFNPLASKNTAKNFFVTALDRNHNESLPSAVVTLTDVPAQPVLALPADNAANQTPSVQFAWNYAEASGSYQLQIASDPAFSTIFYSASIADTTALVSGLKGEKEYYWRVKGVNAVGEGTYSTARKLTTGFPAAPVLLAPNDVLTNTPFTMSFVWQKNPVAASYSFQLSKSADFATTVVDTAGLTDTTITRAALDPYTIYSWRVKSVNAIGSSEWMARRFRTQQASSVKTGTETPSEFQLAQNYPNPFNPDTHIQFSVASLQHVQLDVYDVLGRMVASLVDRDMQPGFYTVQWNGAGAPSGMYFYRLRAGGFSEVRKMLLQK